MRMHNTRGRVEGEFIFPSKTTVVNAFWQQTLIQKLRPCTVKLKRNLGASKMDKTEEPVSFNRAVKDAASSIRRFPLIEVRGVPLRNWIAQNWSSVLAFCPDTSDLLISTYPKAGNITDSLQIRTNHLKLRRETIDGFLSGLELVMIS